MLSRRGIVGSLLLAALAGVASCGGDGTTDPPPPPPPPPPPVAPVAVGSIPAQVLIAGQEVTVDVTPFFSDPDGGALTYAATSSDEAVVAVALSGSSLTVTAVAAGTATVTVTATDPDGLSATQSVGLTVEAANQAPEAVGTIPAQTMNVGDELTVDVAPFFSDPDGDDLAYSAESSAPEAVAVAVEGSVLTVTAVAAGTATVTVTAADPDSLSAAQSAEVTVVQPNRAPEAVGELPAQSLEVGDEATVDVAPLFRDPDGDELMYSAESSAPDAVAVAVEGSVLTVTAVAAGRATVTVTATDPDSLSAAQSAEVTVVQPNRAPEAVGELPAQSLEVGDEATVDVTPLFSDPDGDELMYSAESSAPQSLAVAVEGSVLTVTAVAAGTATVTVTATDPDGLSAAQSAEVTVVQPNRAPEAVGELPAQSLEVGAEATVDVTPFFSDPDGDELMYGAESSAPETVAVAVEGSSLTVTAVAAGRATVTVTATDPDGLSATHGAEVTVQADSIFRDDFDTNASRNNWTPFYVDVRVVDGILRLSGTHSQFLGTVGHVLQTQATDWVLTTRLARSATGEPVLVYWHTGHYRFPTFRLAILDFSNGENWWLAVWDEQAGAYQSISEFSGNSDAIAGPGEFMEISFSHQSGEFALAAGDTELFRLSSAGQLGGIRLGDVVDRVVEIWLGVGADGERGLFDWVDLRGTGIAAEEASGSAPPGVEFLPRTKDPDRMRLGAPPEVPLSGKNR
ncbi:Ig-like domain-containing protein [Candidatus Palauibacter sp.]|uniref:Ig-like domain-containing protein n=1 Tax=Candidatus Palauibacter sp. TaxID=3101350 RepID=UPI003B010B55